MIAEMSSKDEGDETEGAPAGEDSSKPAASSTCDKPVKVESKKSKESAVPVKKPSATRSDTPKSSFAAWKLAKGRKNGTKSPSRKELSVGRKDIPVSSGGIVPNNSLLAGPSAKKFLHATAATDKTTDSSPVKTEAIGSNKKRLSPKKAKKDKDGLSPKKAAKKAAALAASKNGVKMGKGKPKKGDDGTVKAAAFPEKIMELLQGELAPNAIYWLPEGEAIAVDPDSFKDSTVISKQFRGNKLSSFVRSLNRWCDTHSLPKLLKNSIICLVL